MFMIDKRKTGNFELKFLKIKDFSFFFKSIIGTITNNSQSSMWKPTLMHNWGLLTKTNNWVNNQGYYYNIDNRRVLFYFILITHI